VKGSKDVTFASGHRRRGRRTKREEERRVGLTVWALIPGQPHSRLSDLGPAHIRPFLFYFILFFVWKNICSLCMHIIIGFKILDSTTTTPPFWPYLQLVSSLGVEDDHLVLCRRWGRSRTAPPNLLLLLRMNPAEYVHASEWTSAYER
jgi:hypothetical protein